MMQIGRLRCEKCGVVSHAGEDDHVCPKPDLRAKLESIKKRTIWRLKTYTRDADVAANLEEINECLAILDGT